MDLPSFYHKYSPRPILPHRTLVVLQRDWYFIAEQLAPAPHLAHPEGCTALRIVLVTVPRVSRSLTSIIRMGSISTSHLLALFDCFRGQQVEQLASRRLSAAMFVKV